jgi:hypothetical protein
MKSALGLTVFLATLSLNSWSQEIDYDKRNMHIFCASYLTLMSESIDEVDSYAFTEGRFLNERQSPVRLTPGDVDRGRSHRRIDGARAGEC